MSIDPLELSRDTNGVCTAPTTDTPAATIFPSVCTAIAVICPVVETSAKPSLSKLTSEVPSVLNLATKAYESEIPTRRVPPTMILSPVVIATEENEASEGVKKLRRPSESNVLSYSPFERSLATYALVTSDDAVTDPMTTSRPAESKVIDENVPEFVVCGIGKYLTPGVRPETA